MLKNPILTVQAKEIPITPNTTINMTQDEFCNLYAANLKDAINYHINPNENDIRKGKFSIPEVLNLLHSFQIEMDSL